MTEEQVFLAALDLPNGAERSAYLDEVCGQNSERRRQVEELLAAHERSGQFLDEAAAEQMAARPQSPTAQTVALNDEEDDAMADGKKTNASPNDDGADDLQFLSPSTRPDSLGRLGHYEMLQVLGKGGFGIVFRAFDETLQRVVAVKVMAPQIATLSPARKRFLREARSSAAVRHENVVQIYEVGERPLPYLAMEFVPGETLQQKLDRSGPLEVSEVLRIGRHIAEGLAAAHACDLIHRDIKPGNILLEGGSHKAKITDFGLARAADDASISQSGVIAGTPMYMAPEQALGHKLDQRADLFSLGSVLYQMVAGRPPFRAPSTLAVLNRVAEESPRPIPEIIPETPAWLCEIIAKLHAKNPDERFQSAREVADVLADCEAQLKAHAKVKDFSRIPCGKPRRSGRWKWAAAAAILLLPMIALAVTEFAGVTQLFRGRQATPGYAVDPDRRAAEWVLSIGGIVKINETQTEIKAAADLPKEAFTLSLVYLGNNEKVNDADMARLKDCGNLTWLDLNETKVSAAGLAHLKDCRKLTALVLDRTELGESAIAPLKDIKNLTQLYLIKTKFTSAGIQELKQALPLCKIEWDGGVSQPLLPTFTNGIGMEFVIVPKGKSWLGGDKDKLGTQEVEIPADFYLGKYEVTQEEWQKVMGENPSSFSRTGDGKDAVKDIPDADLKRLPVENVSWDQCQLFVAKLNQREKETGWVYRLPKLAEWEYACRGGPMSGKRDSGFDFYFARPTNTLSAERANIDRGINRPVQVGSYEPNRLGLFDMAGNVAEWCDDVGKEEGAKRYLRGGCYLDDPRTCRAQLISTRQSSLKGDTVGLRLARVPSGDPSSEAKTPPTVPDRGAPE